MKSKKIITIFCILIFAIMFLNLSVSFAAGPEMSEIVTSMQDMDSNSNGGKVDNTAENTLGPIINAAIAIIQVAGTGISLIMVTLLGIRYLLASPSDKADVKKQIAPVLIGAIVLFASVNIVQIVANFALKTLNKG